MLPDKLINFMGYLDSNQLIGIADVSLPEIAYITDSIKGAGIAGEIDSPVIGHLQSMTATINWRSLIGQNIKLAAPKTYQLTFRGSSQSYDEVSGEYKSDSIKVVLKCVPKKISLGNFESAAGMGTSGEFEVLYLKLSINGNEEVEVDKINFICKIDGIDYLAKVRKDIGLS